MASQKDDLTAKTIFQLRDMARKLGCSKVSSMKKAELVAFIQEQNGVESVENQKNNQACTVKSTNNNDEDKNEDIDFSSMEIREGVLEICPDGYGFLRAHNYQQGDGDAYISAHKIRKSGLRKGDVVKAYVKKLAENRPLNVQEIIAVNDENPELAFHRANFDSLTPIYPDQRYKLENAENSKDFAIRAIDLVSPIGKGQRGMIVSPPKAGKTTLLKKIAHNIRNNYPEVHFIVLLIDERPEEVTDMKNSISGENVEVVYSTFDEQPEHHKRVAEMVLERAKRLVEQKKDLIILLDSITRLARAYNLTIPPSGRTLSGGLDPAALHMPKKFFGAARNIQEGGSLTILGTALIETGSKMDEVIFEEFKGTGNMELVLDRRLSEKRIFPAIDIYKSGTRKEELLLKQSELEVVYGIRKAMSRMTPADVTESIIETLMHTKSNEEFITLIEKKL